MEDEWTLLSVQGCLFRLPTKMVKSTDWILAKILTSEIPWEKTSDGQIYVDVDPTSFRLILGILSGIVSLSSGDADTLSGTDLTLLKATSRYLMLDKITERVKGILTGHVEAIHEKDQEIATLKEKAEKLHDIESSFADVPSKVYECQAYRTHSSFNQCGCKSIIFGPISVTGDKITCEDCGNDTSRLRKYASQFLLVEDAPHGTDLEDLAFNYRLSKQLN